MRYRGRMEFAHERKIRERNTPRYRLAHWPIWIFVFFLAPGPLTFSLFAHGFNKFNAVWLVLVLIGTGIACYRAQLPGSEHRPYILRFDEDKPNPLYRRVCYTFAWNAILNFALMNLIGLVIAVVNGRWYMAPIYQNVYLPVCALILILGFAGLLPRVMRSTKGEGTERRYFYGAVWSVTAAQTILLVLWKTLPQNSTTNWAKLAVYLGVLAFMGFLTYNGRLPRTRPIVAGELIVD
jgi:L-asparagine transporter-like permease